MTTPTAPLRILHLFVSPGHNFYGHHGKPAGTHPTLEVPQVQCRAGRGIEGDRFLDYEDQYQGQITFFSHEIYENLCRKLGIADKDPGVFRRNVITRGCDLNDLIGVEFEIQGVRFAGTEESKPCGWMNQAFGPGAQAALKGHGGLRARILSDGILRSG